MCITAVANFPTLMSEIQTDGTLAQDSLAIAVLRLQESWFTVFSADVSILGKSKQEAQQGKADREKEAATPFLKSGSVSNSRCPTRICIEFKHGHPPCHDSKHDNSNSDDIDTQTGFYLKERGEGKERIFLPIETESPNLIKKFCKTTIHTRVTICKLENSRFKSQSGHEPIRQF